MLNLVVLPGVGGVGHFKSPGACGHCLWVKKRYFPQSSCWLLLCQGQLSGATQASSPEPVRRPQPCTGPPEQTLRPFISPRVIPHGGPLMQHCVFPQQPVGQGRCLAQAMTTGWPWAPEHRRRLDKALAWFRSWPTRQSTASRRAAHAGASMAPVDSGRRGRRWRGELAARSVAKHNVRACSGPAAPVFRTGVLRQLPTRGSSCPDTPGARAGETTSICRPSFGARASSPPTG